MNNSKKIRQIKFLQDLDNSDFLSIFDDLNEGVLVTNIKGVIVYYNRAMSRIDELNPDNVISCKLTDIYELDDITSGILRCLAKQKPIIDEPIYYRTRMGKFANTIHNVMPIFNKHKLVGAICFVRDYHALTKTIASMPLPDKDQQFDNTSITFQKIIGKAPVFVDAIHAARMAANTPSPIMLFGETGTGKELFARAIHNHSSRKTKNYTPVNCAAIPENLLEGILFGTSKGAFTGSVEKAGLFERTNKGTIFLDEVNSMPVGLQSKILRSIQESKVRRVGALKEIATNLKIISSINNDPHISISDGTLRSDLFYRLGVVFIHIVPLRERISDLELLVNYFIKKHNVLLDKKVSKISNEAQELFKAYSWPGNVRELEHVIEGAMNIMGSNKTIRIKYLQNRFSNWPAKPGSSKPGPAKLGRRYGDKLSTDSTTSLIKKKSAHEENIIQNNLRENRGNITKTAKSLGISRQLLYYKIKKFNINRDITL
jgi:arginine utilization regulatory protein